MTKISLACVLLLALTGCRGGGGSGSGSAAQIPAIAVSVSPNTFSVKTGGAQQFTATVTGASNTSVMRSVNGVAGGNATFGTISAAGLYTAPVIVPSPNPVTESTRARD